MRADAPTVVEVIERTIQNPKETAPFTPDAQEDAGSRETEARAVRPDAQDQAPVFAAFERCRARGIRGPVNSGMRASQFKGLVQEPLGVSPEEEQRRFDKLITVIGEESAQSHPRFRTNA